MTDWTETKEMADEGKRIDKKMKGNYKIIHLVADCEDCKWSTADYLKGQDKARRHAKVKGHNVIIEIGTYGRYEGRYKRGNDEAMEER